MTYDNETEALIDIAVQAGQMLSTGRIRVADSRTVPMVIFEAAELFQQTHAATNWDETNYIETVSEFADRELRRLFGADSRNFVYPTPPAPKPGRKKRG